MPSDGVVTLSAWVVVTVVSMLPTAARIVMLEKLMIL